MATEAITTAMILAAGRGERMRPLTDHIPKPLLQVAGKPLIVWHLENLAAAGFQRVVINLAHLGEQIAHPLGDGSNWGLELCYSDESQGALETAGGIIKALPLLGDKPFLLVNGDVWSDVEFSKLNELPHGTLAHLMLVKNPAHHPKGDFSLSQHTLVIPHEGAPTYTYSGIGLYSPELFIGQPQGRMALAPLIRQAMTQDQVQGYVHQGQWCDVGTPERLAQLNQQQELD